MTNEQDLTFKASTIHIGKKMVWKIDDMKMKIVGYIATTLLKRDMHTLHNECKH